MAWEWEWPADLRLQLVICAGFIAATIILVRIGILRAVIARIGAAVLEGTRRVAAWVIRLFNKVIPVDGRNGRLPPVNFAIWILLNASVVGAWIVTSEAPIAAPYAQVAAAASAAFTVLNLLLLGASYWAVRETIEITNGDMARDEARFAETSPSRSIVFVIGTALVLVMQIAVVVDWTQQARAIVLIKDDGVIGPRYLNFLLATVDALPLASLYVAPLARHASFAGSLFALALSRGLNGLGSILIVSTAIGLIQQRAVFQRMVDKLVDAPAFDPALLARLMNTPDAVKGYISQAFRSASDDQRRLKLAQLAVRRGTFSFPRTFAAGYKHYGPELREAGTQLVADFLESQRLTFREVSLQGLFEVCDWGVHKGFAEPNERRRMARVVVPALEALLDLNAEAGKARILSVMGRRILSASLAGGADAGLRVRAAHLMLKADSCEPIARLLRATPNFDESMVREILRGIVELLRTAKLPAVQREARAVLEDIAQAAKKAESKLPAYAAGPLASIKRAVRRRQRAGRETERIDLENEPVVAIAAPADQPTPAT